jgi:hypothetical protein
MGIRIHKVVGYGLTDLSFNEDKKRCSKEMTDPRIDWKRLHGLGERMCETSGRSFMNWATKHWEDLLRLEAEERRVPLEMVKEFSSICPFLLRDFFKRHREWTLGGCVVHDNEYGLPNVMVFIPPMQAHTGDGGWKRWDDTIDYIEEAIIHRADNRVVELECSGIYPYDGSMVRFRDPKPGLWRSGIKAVAEGLKVDAEGRPTAMSGQSYNMLVGRWDPGRIEPMAKGELLDHLLKDWRPPLPSELLALLRWLNEKDCFNDFEAVRNGLRPILYVYWS